MNYIWIIYELYMNYIWIIYELCMNIYKNITKNNKRKEKLILFKKFNKVNWRIIFYYLNLNMFDELDI
jgi:hypothetical protein